MGSLRSLPACYPDESEFSTASGSVILRHFDRQVFARKDEIWPAAAFHKLRGGLRERGDDDWQRDRRVAVDVGSERATPELAVNQRFVKRNGARTATRMRRVGGDLNRVFVAVN